MRRKDREVTNIIEILQIIEKAKVLHLALFDAGGAAVPPLGRAGRGRGVPAVGIGFWMRLWKRY